MKRHHLIGLLLAACAWPAANAGADMITYTVDPTQSSLTISGTFEGDPLQPQSGVPDSLTTSYGGSITAERDLGGVTPFESRAAQSQPKTAMRPAPRNSDRQITVSVRLGALRTWFSMVPLSISPFHFSVKL